MLESEIRHEPETLSMIALFRAYCDQKFGPDAWDMYMQDNEFSFAMNDIQPKHGDIAFKFLVDHVHMVEGIKIWDILRDFQHFKNTYF